MAGNNPERRSYHTTFIFESKLYIYGGLDIQNGSLSSLWELDLTKISDLESDDLERRQSCSWQEIKQQGSKNSMPGPVAYHSSCVHKDQMFLFGGNNYSKTVQIVDANSENSERTYSPLFSLNLKTFAWT